MREHELRAWNKGNGYMLSHEDIIKHLKMCYGMWETYDLFNDPAFELMQYTGLKDSKGQKIYEGDIYHQGDINIKYVVVWNDSGLIGKQCRSSSYAGLQYWQNKIEIIGNIYENKELLEG